MNALLILISLATFIVAPPPPIRFDLTSPPGGFIQPTDNCLRRRMRSQQIMPAEAEMNGFRRNPYGSGCCDNVLNGYGGARCGTR